MTVQDRHVDLQKCSEEFFGIAGTNKEIVDIAEAFACFVLHQRKQHELAEIDQLLIQASLEFGNDQAVIDERLTATGLLHKVMLQRGLVDEPTLATDVLATLRTIDAHWNADAVDWELLISEMEDIK